MKIFEDGIQVIENIDDLRQVSKKKISRKTKFTPRQAIKAKCLDCMTGSREEVRLCHIASCDFHKSRFGKRSVDETRTPMKIIKEFCLECSGGIKKEVRNCPLEDCAVYLFRLGKNPNLAGKRKSNLGVYKEKIRAC